MAYDENLATHIRLLLSGQPGLVEKKMFGGIGFILRGNMACGVHGSDFIARIGAEKSQQALSLPGVKPFDMTGRPMAGWVVVEPAGIASDDDLRGWVERSVAFTLTLPEK